MLCLGSAMFRQCYVCVVVSKYLLEGVKFLAVFFLRSRCAGNI
jgi:hypothetical protein